MHNRCQAGRRGGGGGRRCRRAVQLVAVGVDRVIGFVYKSLACRFAWRCRFAARTRRLPLEHFVDERRSSDRLEPRAAAHSERALLLFCAHFVIERVELLGEWRHRVLVDEALATWIERVIGRRRGFGVAEAAERRRFVYAAAAILDVHRYAEMRAERIVSQR